jgi:fused signal recognition particle receptor
MVTWISALAKTRDRIAGALSRVFTRGTRVDEAAIEDIESTLVQADIPYASAAAWAEEIRKSYKGLEVSPKDMLRKILVRSFAETPAFSWDGAEKPLTILVVGINGSGKTTSCAKLAYLAKKAGRRPLLGAADTFRAAGSDQLKIWADRIGCDVVGGATGADSAAVAFDALDAARARGSDVVIIDTAGRMHTRQPLMQELEKIRRAVSKKVPSAPHETWIVLDASMGQNAISQARQFHASAPLTGAVVAKLDGSAKAGFVFSIHKELGVPIRFIGLGEGADDLVPFDAQSFVDGLLGIEAAGRGG